MNIEKFLGSPAQDYVERLLLLPKTVTQNETPEDWVALAKLAESDFKKTSFLIQLCVRHAKGKSLNDALGWLKGFLEGKKVRELKAFFGAFPLRVGAYQLYAFNIGTIELYPSVVYFEVEPRINELLVKAGLEGECGAELERTIIVNVGACEYLPNLKIEWKWEDNCIIGESEVMPKR